jgi:hypothetical protein
MPQRTPTWHNSKKNKIKKKKRILTSSSFLNPKQVCWWMNLCSHFPATEPSSLLCTSFVSNKAEANSRAFPPCDLLWFPLGRIPALNSLSQHQHVLLRGWLYMASYFCYITNSLRPGVMSWITFVRSHISSFTWRRRSQNIYCIGVTMTKIY